MMALLRRLRYFLLASLFHAIVLLVLIFGFEFSSPLLVVENTNKQDVISAVVLGDSAKSKILPEELKSQPEPIKEEKPKPEPEQIQVKKTVTPPTEKDVINLLAAQKKKLAEKKALEEKKRHDKLEKALLAEIKKQKKLKQKALQAKFQKTLREQAEETMRQQLLDEDIKMKSKESRDAQGIVNKYAALIKQSIEEHWILPPQVNKKLVCELKIRVAPTGTVLDVQITRSSGDSTLDSSARAAVFKASPLPVPHDKAAFETFREFALKVKPENILASDRL